MSPSLQSSRSLFSTPPLILIAHLWEARKILDRFDLNLKHLPGISHYYEGKNFHLFITGQGGEKVILQTTRLLSFLQASKEYYPNQLINLGVAGQFDFKSKVVQPDSNIPKIGQAYIVNTAYALVNLEPKFRSFESQSSATSPTTSFTLNGNSLKSTDCVSTDKLLGSEVLEEVSKLFPAVRLCDQELWYLGYVAKQFKLPLISCKVISDLITANQATQNDGQLVKEIRNNSKFSGTLYQWVKENLVDGNSTQPVEQRSFPWETDQFHFTQAQRKIFKVALQGMIEAEDSYEAILEKIKWSDFEEQLLGKEITPKKRSHLLLDHLNLLSNSYLRKFKNAINQLELKNLQLEYDPQLEAKNIKFSFNADSVEKFSKQLETIKTINPQQISKLFHLYSGEEDL